VAEESDWRLGELRRLGEAERRLEIELLEARNAIAQLIVELLPPHASGKRIDDVVEASGFSRTLVERVRGGQGMWLRP
jgi:hypothetical protein